MAKDNIGRDDTTGTAAQKQVKYRRVVFNERISEAEPERLVFSHNGGIPLKINRGVEVVLPDYILALARDAKMILENENGGFSVVHRATYIDKGEATEEEFIAMRNSGTAATRKVIDDKLKQASR